MAQEAILWEDASRWYWELFEDEHGDAGVYNAFAYSMLLTGQPQFIGIRDDAGGGHALIVYGKRGHSLLVSDPNYPIWRKGGETDRLITFNPDLQGFDPYYSGPNADDLGYAYTEFIYFGYRDIIDWEALGDLWSDLENGVVGGDAFPAYRLMVQELDAGAEELWPNHDADSSQILVHVTAEFSPYLFVYDASGKRVAEGREPIPLNLAQGDNYFGFEIDALGSEGKPSWVGFDWVKITYGGEADTAVTYYEGSWSDSFGQSGEFTLTVYDSGKVWLSLTESSGGIAGTHENGRLTIPFNESFVATGTLDAEGVAASGSSGEASFQMSGVRVP